MAEKPARVKKVSLRAWQRMLSGRRLDLLHPSPLDIEIEDIAHGLARVARWNGQTIGDHAYSVAQHSLLVEQIMGMIAPQSTKSELLAALLHDAPEYVIGDMISPFKVAIGGDYKEVEHRLQSAIHLRFGLPAFLSDKQTKLIKRADKIAAYFEATELAGFSKAEGAEIFGRPRGITADLIDFTPKPSAEIQLLFLQRFKQLSAMPDPV